jgi:hypothetical protein
MRDALMFDENVDETVNENKRVEDKK